MIAGLPSESERYQPKDLARLAGLSLGQLRRWRRSGLLPATAGDDNGPQYRFQDVIAARAAKKLLAEGISTRRVREAVEAIRGWDPTLANPLATLKIEAQQGRLVVRLEESLVDTLNGQTLMDLPLEADEGPAKVATIRALPRRGAAEIEMLLERAAAHELSGELPRARSLYERALVLDPEHAGALLNLGNVLFAQGESELARAMYLRACDLDPSYADAWYNLANARDEMGSATLAVEAYERALELAPEFSDAHFNLALLYEKTGQRDRARPHWAKYLDLDVGSASAEIARQFLES